MVLKKSLCVLASLRHGVKFSIAALVPKKVYILFTTIFLIAVQEGIYARKGEPEEETPQEVEVEPWFTGTLLCPSGNVVPVGYVNIEPYVFATDTFAKYNRNWKSKSIPCFWSVNPLIFTQIGLTEKLDFLFQPQFFWNETQGRSSTRFGDLPVGLDIQLVAATKTGWWPAVKLALRENLPTGKYQKLNPDKLGTDASGTGSFVTTAGLVFARLFHVRKAQYLSTRFFVSYSLPARVHVKGFNTYGGGSGTRGYVYPGDSLTAIVGLEYSLTRNWVLALDMMNVYTNKNRFKGRKGRAAGASENPFEGFETTDGSGEANVGGPSSDQISLAPAIEYNFSEAVGIIGGCWFTVAGRNTGHFVSGVLAVNWYLQLSKNK